MVKRLLLAIHQHLGLEFEYEITTYEFYNKYNGKVGFSTIHHEYGNKRKKMKS